MSVGCASSLFRANSRPMNGMLATPGSPVSPRRWFNLGEVYCKNPVIISRTPATVGEAPEVPQRSPGRGPPYGKSRVLRLKDLGDEEAGGGRGSGADEVALGA
jgi:hypothetical protein